MTTNRKLVKEFIAAAIDFDGYSVEETDKNKRVLLAMSICRSEVGHLESKSRQAMVEYWLSGLCSVVSLPYLYADIIPLAVAWGSLPADYTEKQADKILENWFRYMAAQFCQMVDNAERPRMA